MSMKITCKMQFPRRSKPKSKAEEKKSDDTCIHLHHGHSRTRFRLCTYGISQQRGTSSSKRRTKLPATTNTTSTSRIQPASVDLSHPPTQERKTPQSTNRTTPQTHLFDRISPSAVAGSLLVSVRPCERSRLLCHPASTTKQKLVRSGRSSQKKGTVTWKLRDGILSFLAVHGDQRWTLSLSPTTVPFGQPARSCELTTGPGNRDSRSRTSVAVEVKVGTISILLASPI